MINENIQNIIFSKYFDFRLYPLEDILDSFPRSYSITTGVPRVTQVENFARIFFNIVSLYVDSKEDDIVVAKYKNGEFSLADSIDSGIVESINGRFEVPQSIKKEYSSILKYNFSSLDEYESFLEEKFSKGDLKQYSNYLSEVQNKIHLFPTFERDSTNFYKEAGEENGKPKRYFYPDCYMSSLTSNNLPVAFFIAGRNDANRHTFNFVFDRFQFDNYTKRRRYVQGRDI